MAGDSNDVKQSRQCQLRAILETGANGISGEPWELVFVTVMSCIEESHISRSDEALIHVFPSEAVISMYNMIHWDLSMLTMRALFRHG